VHPNIVQFIGHTPLNREHIYILMEYFPNGNLQSVLKNSSIKLPWATRLQIAIDIAKAMFYLHGKHFKENSLC
jgi:serine/threonine protein kinase